jgi:hypothetical protein
MVFEGWMVEVLTSAASPSRIDAMRRAFGDEIKVAVDVELEIVAWGGSLHYDCESALLAEGSQSDDVWGASWNAATHEVTFSSVINYRPNRGLRSPILQSPELRARVERVVRALLEGA